MALRVQPVDFKFQLIRFDQSWRFVEFTELSEEEHEAMSPGPLIPESTDGPDGGTPLRGKPHNSHYAVTVPILGVRWCGSGGECQAVVEDCRSASRDLHGGAIPRRSWAVASVALAVVLGACSDLTVPSDSLLGTDDLLILAMQADAPQPESVSFWVYNSRQTVRRLVHPHAQLIPFLELTFPAGSLASLDGDPLADGDSALVTVDPWTGQYGVTLSPSGLSFNASVAPTAKFFFGFFADATVADQSSTYATSADYAAALEIWHEITVAQWQVAHNSGPAGIDAISATTAATGEYVLAAPK